MAESTYRAVWVAAISAFITGIGIVLVWSTLKEARAATAAAVVASKYAGEAVQVTRDSAEKQLRAYLLPDKITFLEHSSNDLWVGVVIKNTGQTPARDTRSRVHCAVVPNSIDDYPFMVKLGAPLGTIGPGQKFTARFLEPNGNTFTDQWRSIRSGAAIFYVWGAAEYIDAFGNKQTARFRYRYSTYSDDFVPCDEGNEST